MVPAGNAGQEFILVNRTGNSVDINNDTGATAADRILTGTGATLALLNNSAVLLEYDTTTTRWQIVGGSGGGGGSGANDTLSNLASPTAINQNLTFDASRELNTADDATADANPTDNITISSGDKTAGTGDSGDITIECGSSSGGSKGDVTLNGTTIKVGGLFGATLRNLVQVDAAGRMQMGQGGVDFRINGPVTPVADGTLNNGSAALRWLNVSADQFEGAGGMTMAAHTTPSGIGSVSSFESSVMIDAGLLSSSDANADAIKSGDIFIETGNKTNAGSSGDTGDIQLKTGDSSGSGDSGDVIIDTGTVSTGTRGTINIKGPSLTGSSVNDVWTLQSTVTGEGAWATAASAGPKVVQTYNSTTTIGSTVDVAILSGASFTLTLTTAVGNTGKVFEIIHNGTSLSQVYTIDGNAAETIRGNTTFLLHTNGQRVRLVSDGSGWVVLDHYTETDWSSSSTITFNADTTAPTKGTTTTDSVIWRRSGRNAILNYQYVQTSAGTAGSGEYIFGLPTNISVDTAIIPVLTGSLGTGATTADQRSRVGNGHISNGTARGDCYVFVESATELKLLATLSFTNHEVVDQAYFPLSATNIGYGFDLTIPVDGWEH